MQPSSGSSASYVLMMKTLKLVGGLLTIVVSPLLAIWLDYPFTLPHFSAVTIEKMLVSSIWLVFILGLYYREKINAVYRHHTG